MSKITVLLAEDHTIVRKGLRSLLESRADIKVVGEAENGREAIDRVEELRPDVVVMDIGMPGLNGLEATRRIKKRFGDVQVLILTVHTGEEYILQILRAGASGYLVKQAAPAELISAIQAVHRGEAFLSPSISKKVLEDYVQRAGATAQRDSFERLTDREREVLQLIAEAYSTREIAEQLHISIKTAETHRAHLMEKLSLHSTAELTRYAIRKGVVTLDR
ncbi:MAG TPA: response regulator transcription factor [Anaerolineae bacterium]|nr:response regulator transcription factor [Anaerolineae bacterium]